MTDKDKIMQRNTLNEALKESFMKMLEWKKELGQPIVTGDGEGNPIVMSA